MGRFIKYAVFREMPRWPHLPLTEPYDTLEMAALALQERMNAGEAVGREMVRYTIAGLSGPPIPVSLHPRLR